MSSPVMPLSQVVVHGVSSFEERHLSAAVAPTVDRNVWSIKAAFVRVV